MLPASVAGVTDSIPNTDTEEISLTLAPDEIAIPDSLGDASIENKISHEWLYLLRNHQLKLDDKSVSWSPFLGFFVNIYNWINRTFCYNDPEYVEKGKVGKVMVNTDDWADFYVFHPDNAPRINMQSRLYSNVGVKVGYSIISLGYSVDFETLFRKRSSTHKKWDFSLNTALLSANIHYWNNKGSSYISSYGRFRFSERETYRENFDGLDFETVEANLVYYFNHDHFCFAAGYGSGSKQLRSCGTAILGGDYSFYDAEFDFSKPPASLEDSEKYPYSNYSLLYASYCITGGYSYNWVCNRHFLVNGTLLPKFGITMSRSNSTPGKRALTAMGIRAMCSITYYSGRYFISVNNNFAANRFQTSHVAFTSAIENFQISAGLRF